MLTVLYWVAGICEEMAQSTVIYNIPWSRWWGNWFCQGICRWRGRIWPLPLRPHELPEERYRWWTHYISVRQTNKAMTWRTSTTALNPKLFIKHFIKKWKNKFTSVLIACLVFSLSLLYYIGYFIALCKHTHTRTHTPLVTLLTQKSKLSFMFRNNPPTIAARWMTCVGRCFWKSALVASRSLQPITEEQVRSHKGYGSWPEDSKDLQGTRNIMAQWGGGWQSS